MDVLAYFKAARNVLAVPAGVIVFQEGEPARDMYVLLQGTAEISVGGELVEIAQPGALLGELALVDAGPRSATVITRTDCRVVSVNTPQFDLLVRESPEFGRHVMKVMAERLRRTNEKLRLAIDELAGRGSRPR